jgi:hypothetical protein
MYRRNTTYLYSCPADENFVTTHHTSGRHYPEDCILERHHHENIQFYLKYHILCFVCFLSGNYTASGVYMPGNYLKESIQHTENGESLKSRMSCVADFVSLCHRILAHGVRSNAEEVV